MVYLSRDRRLPGRATIRGPANAVSRAAPRDQHEDMVKQLCGAAGPSNMAGQRQS